MALTRVTRRGGTTDVDTMEMLDEIGRLSGEIYVEILQGDRTSDNANSGGTHAGDSVVDLWVRGTDAKDCLRIGKRLEYLARMVGAFAWYRPELRKDDGTLVWRPHVHLGRTDSPGLSAAAKDQRAQYFEGFNGMPLYKRTVKDTGTREFLDVRWLTNYKPKEDEMVTSAEMSQIADLTVSRLLGKRIAYPGAPDTDRKPPFQEWFIGMAMRTSVINAGVTKVLAEVGASAPSEAEIARLLAAEIGDDVKATLTEVLLSNGLPNASAIVDEFLSRLSK
ncbi:MAG TPA: hypothetical protein VJ323_22565 [Bryobacteraceae bacterium]|nr:hypothetical protein [Bryobacteraceae bacterium]